jgi:hypothetical protein
MTSALRPSYATIVKQSVARFRDPNTMSDKYAEIEYSEEYNQFKLKPPTTTSTSRLAAVVSIEQAGGAHPTLNFYNTESGKYANIGLFNDKLTMDKNVNIIRQDAESPLPSLSLSYDNSGLSASVEYAPTFNELKLKPVSSAGSGSVTIEQAGGAPPALNFYSPTNSTFGRIKLDASGTIVSEKNMKLEANGFGGDGQLECASIRISSAPVTGAGAATSNYLPITVNGVSYKILLYNP